MRNIWMDWKWIPATIFGSTVFAIGFAFFLAPNDMNSGGISGLAQVIVELLGFGSVGTLSILINLPLFILGGVKIGKRFFFGSALGLVLSSALIDLFATVQRPAIDPLMGVIYGGVTDRSMISMDNELISLYRAGKIEKDIAIAYAVNADSMKKRLM